jgi:DNA-binding response OmpR family regulator
MDQEQESKKILIVEDEADIRRVLCAYLQYAGFQVRGAAHGCEAIRIIPEFNPHLVVLDLMMQPTNGWEVLHWLRTNQICPPMPVIILTAISNIKEQVRGFEEGAMEYMEKPTQPSKLAERIRAILSLTNEQRLLLRNERMERQRRIMEQLYAPQTDDVLY